MARRLINIGWTLGTAVVCYDAYQTTTITKAFFALFCIYGTYVVWTEN